MIPSRRLLHLSARLVAGRHYWLALLVPLLWPAFQAVLLLSGGRDEGFAPEAAQNTLIGLPLTVLAIFLGIRVIAGEVDARRLEIAYTVPGGSHRVWLGKLLASWGLLVASEVMLALVVFVFFVTFPWGALYGALQAATVYLVLAMGLAALFKSEITGAMVAAGVLTLNGFLTGFGGNQTRLSPFWNPAVVKNADPSLIAAWTLQNRVGFALAAAALVALAFARAERREAMLAG